MGARMRRGAIGFGVALLLILILSQTGQGAVSAVPQDLATLTIFVMFIHATVALGFTAVLGFSGIIVAVTFAVENLGVATGFPFGEYHFVVGGDLPHVWHNP